jgi:hypothetical protein
MVASFERRNMYTSCNYMYFEIDDAGLGLGCYIYTIFRVFDRYTRNEPVDGHI